MTAVNNSSMVDKLGDVALKAFNPARRGHRKTLKSERCQLQNNKHYIDKEPTVEKCQELSKQLFYTRLASLPHRYEAFWKEIDALKKKAMARQDLKIEEVGVAALFGLECYAWFCVGEIFGRGGTLTGYYP
ncbi:hypothetical protein SUGI_1199190 [Cryptomeria japonica]|nr:hypothetical protein SUGI_1199190 [Cryptomeria japonica]